MFQAPEIFSYVRVMGVEICVEGAASCDKIRSFHRALFQVKMKAHARTRRTLFELGYDIEDDNVSS